ncbi:MAG: hypothetical protein AAF327_18095 [Cyanobacteria bacterium P01_A01_bin.37]
MTLIGFEHKNRLSTLVFEVFGSYDSQSISDLAIACKENDRTPTKEEFSSLPGVVSIVLFDQNRKITWKVDKNGEWDLSPCVDCHYYHGKDKIVCALHPPGVYGDCVDFREA